MKRSVARGSQADTSAPRRPPPPASYLGFVEEVSEAAAGVLLGAGAHLQDELHHHRLVGHLLHQRLLLHKHHPPAPSAPPSAQHRRRRVRSRAETEDIALPYIAIIV